MIIGITGSFGSGKSTVAKMFARLGLAVLDADEIAHSVLKSKRDLLIKMFGEDIAAANKKIDRNKLGEVVFSDKKKLVKLNNVMHPEIVKVIKERIRKAGSRAVVLDAPLLIETGLEKITDKLIVVKATRKNQLKRIKSAMNLTNRQILERIKAQMPFKEKVRLADFIIDNNGTVEKTKKQVMTIWKEMEWRS